MLFLCWLFSLSAKHLWLVLSLGHRDHLSHCWHCTGLTDWEGCCGVIGLFLLLQGSLSGLLGEAGIRVWCDVTSVYCQTTLASEPVKTGYTEQHHTAHRSASGAPLCIVPGLVSFPPERPLAVKALYLLLWLPCLLFICIQSSTVGLPPAHPG